jgi:hypothetical protein
MLTAAMTRAPYRRLKLTIIASSGDLQFSTNLRAETDRIRYNVYTVENRFRKKPRENVNKYFFSFTNNRPHRY